MVKELNKKLKDFRYIAHVLSKDIRIDILSLISEEKLNVKEIAARLGIHDSTATVNIKKLEEAGLITTENIPGKHGSQKICSLKYDKIILSLKKPEIINNGNGTKEKSIEISMPIGHFIDCEIYETCGLAGLEERIGKMDKIQNFYLPEKIQAHLIWAGKNSKLKYHFPMNIPPKSKIHSMEFSCELCSETKTHKADFPSDISLWINDIEVGMWTSPGDFGGKHGKFTPKYWRNINTQFGILTNWEINSDGTFLNEEKISEVNIEQIKFQENQHYISIKIGIKKDSKNVNGFNLFGSKFGNYDQDLLFKIHYSDI